MITSAYIKGVQRYMVENDLVRYASEEQAEGDAEQLGGAVEEQLPVDQGAIAQEGAAPQATHIVAQALSEMAQHAAEDAQVAGAKAEVVQNAISAIAKTGSLKYASSPGDNNVVAGHRPGRVAGGESSAQSSDHDEELSNAVDNTAKRQSYFNPNPGKTGLKGGVIGKESAHPGANAQGPVSPDHDQELSNAVPNTAHRPSYHGAPGKTDLKGGKIGNERPNNGEKNASLSNYLASL